VVLEEREAGYRGIFESDPRPMWICDVETLAFLAVNDAALALYGYRREEFLGLSLPGIAAGAGRHLKKDGTAVEVECTEREVSFAGRKGRLVAVRPAGDPAELERLLAEKSAQLESAQKELESFSYSVSHDLRAPLRHIDGFSKALLDDYREKLDATALEYLERIGRAAQKMSQLIDDLQKLGRVARTDLQRQSVNLSVMAQVISLELKHAEPQRTVEFEIAQGVTGDADPRLVRLLLEILMGNAWKFSSHNPSGRIEFGVEERAGERVYLVRDDGVGFDGAYADKLFTVFHRLHRSDEFEGAGVGLAIARRIVQRHGGRIWAEGELGRGAVFYFTLQGEVS
jgi:light-regulated signal transduction histidine kinase (bacteriophytochrome)